MVARGGAGCRRWDRVNGESPGWYLVGVRFAFDARHHWNRSSPAQCRWLRANGCRSVPNDGERSDLDLERKEVTADPNAELAELAAIYVRRGVPDALA